LERVRPILAYPVPARRLLYATNAIESLNGVLCRVLKIRGASRTTTRPDAVISRAPELSDPVSEPPRT